SSTCWAIRHACRMAATSGGVLIRPMQTAVQGTVPNRSRFAHDARKCFSMNRKSRSKPSAHAPLLQEAIVMAHEQEGFELPQGVQQNTHGDQNAGSSKEGGHVKGHPKDSVKNDREDRDRRKEDRPGKG